MVNNLSTEELIDFIDNNPLSSKKYECLINAINDWPNKIDKVEDYFNQVKKFLDVEEIDFKTIKKKKKKLKFTGNNAWELESISELLLFLKS